MSGTNSTKSEPTESVAASVQLLPDVGDSQRNMESDDSGFFSVQDVNNVTTTDNNNIDDSDNITTTTEQIHNDEVVDNVDEVRDINNDDVEESDDEELVVPVGNNVRNIVTLDTIRDNIVAANTFKSYVGDITKFLLWVIDNEETWLTDYGKDQLADAFHREEDVSLCVYRVRSQNFIKNILRSAYTNPLLHLNLVLPARYMDFILTVKGRNGRFMSKSAYGNKRSALYHLFRLHNRRGYSNEFKLELSSLFKGFYRQITADRSQGDIGETNKEGKEPMSVELYKAICRWFLDYGTTDGVFGYCYLVLTWNLACRSRNTARIQFNDESWTTSFDSFSIAFGHSKTDQLGEEAKYPRHLYSNPLSPLVCPVVALSIYFACCFNTVQTARGSLFPGRFQESRFSSLLSSVVEENWDMISDMGYLEGEIGTHSIRKGAVSYLSSLPGGPPAAATCIRAGWTMGKVKDVYMRYVTSGDQFVGRTLSLLSVLKSDFAISPPHFKSELYEWVEPMRKIQFPMMSNIASLKKLTRMTLATTLFHHGWFSSVMGTNHVYLVCSAVHRLGYIDKAEYVHTTYPWDDPSNNAFSGIPPHASLIQTLSTIQHRQSMLVEEFIRRMTVVLEQFGVNGGRMSEENLRTMLAEFQAQFREQLNVNNNLDAVVAAPPGIINNLEVTRQYEYHYYDGSFKRVPADWRFPRCGVFDIFRQWWIGDSHRNIPPLGRLKADHFSHLDRLPLEEEEMHGRTGRFKDRRRPASKIFSDLKFLMNYLHDKIVERNAYSGIG